MSVGWSVMEGAVKNLVSGIDADRGGACATCHVYVDAAWLGKLEPKSDMEETMLDFAQELEPNSRLSAWPSKGASPMAGMTWDRSALSKPLGTGREGPWGT